MICVQEPTSYSSTKTQNHLEYNYFVLVDLQDSIDLEQHKAKRPCVITYIWKRVGPWTQQYYLIYYYDLLQIDINSYTILNVYRQPLSLEVIKYITYLSPLANYLVGGDFNTQYNIFKSRVQLVYQEAKLAYQLSNSTIDFISIPRESIQRVGYILDFTFLNISFA